ncbi:MAG TPA: serine hydrolase domain-containing protein [Hymenobacter sp.]|uniref:serine hydrolase domain-containing protein n=1 Tax=Hymenobacter sp. TaxID=1898978 RepID=UPI002ED9BDC9
MKFLLTLLLGLLWLKSAAQTGIVVPELAHCDESMQQFMRKWNVLGASVAITKDGQLAYERAFGYATAERNVPMQPYHLLRVASISKTVTALAVMKLVEEGQLSLSHKVFGAEGYLQGASYLREMRDPRLRDITVQHLLEHSAGWDRNAGCDGYEGCDPIDFPTHVAQVMRVPNPVGDSTIIRYMLRQGLSFAPGTRFAYSNVGYLVLGKVLEAVTHQPYEAWVQAHILHPSGVFEAHLGRNLPAARLERESGYLSRYRMLSCYNPGKQAPAAYGGFHMEAMGAHGGWLFSARDLVRLTLAADGFDSRPDLISAETLSSMTQPSAKAAGYAKGWMVNGGTWWHTGQLDGTACLVARTAGGHTWAILLNTSNGSPEFWQELKALGWGWVKKAATWPTHDLFPPAQNATHLWASATDAAQIRLAWANGSGSRRLVLLKADGPSKAFPLDGQDYPTGSKLADGSIVAYNGTDSTVELSHLSPRHTYHARVVEYRQEEATAQRPVYALDGNPVEILPPLVLPQHPQFAFHRNHGSGPEDASGADQASAAPPSASRAYFLRIRRAWRRSLSHFVKL